MPVSVVTVTTYKRFYFTGCIANTLQRGCTWEITRKTVTHLISQLLTPSFSHL